MKHANRTIGLIHGGGTGPEIVEATKEVIRGVADRFGVQFELRDFDNQRYAEAVNVEQWDAELYKALSAFYGEIREQGGAIIRGSMPAPILYKLRTEEGFNTKLVPLNPYPEHSTHPEFDVLLVRENSQGVYHLDEIRRRGGVVEGRFHYDRESLEDLAEAAFDQATRRRGSVALVLKTSVLGEVGALWKSVFEEKSREYPGVNYTLRPSGAGFSDMLLYPRLYDVVVTDDEGGDIIADVVPTLLYGTRNLVPARNIGPGGFSVYQTDHGTNKPLTGKNKMNPVGMISAFGMALEHSFGMGKAAKALQRAVIRTLFHYRTEDMHQEGRGYVLVGTREMTEHILENL